MVDILHTVTEREEKRMNTSLEKMVRNAIFNVMLAFRDWRQYSDLQMTKSELKAKAAEREAKFEAKKEKRRELVVSLAKPFMFGFTLVRRAPLLTYIFYTQSKFKEKMKKQQEKLKKREMLENTERKSGNLPESGKRGKKVSDLPTFRSA